MRRPSALVAAALVVAGLAAPAYAVGRTDVVGGELLATHGTVVGAGAPALPATTAGGWLVADMDTGAVLAAHYPHGRFAPASTLKVLTAATLIPRLSPKTMVRPTFADLNVDGSRVGIVQQMTYSVHDLFTAMLVVSGNDAANTLATANGGVPRTVAEMNALAHQLQAYDTRARNANGLDEPGQVSSPYDLALIGRAAMKLPDFRAYVATKRYLLPAPGHKTIYLGSHDKLLWNYNGAIGIKNGYTTKAEATFVGAATRGGHTLIVTLMKTAPRYWPEAAHLLDWGFAAEARGISPVGQLVDPLPDRTVQPVSQAVAAPRTAKAAQTGSDFPVLPSALVGSGLVVMTGGLLRTRRRRRRSGRLRLDLPL